MPHRDRQSVTRHAWARALATVRALYGIALLLTPTSALERAARMPLDPRAVRVARVLGLRQLAQSLCLRRGSRAALLAGAGIDAAHGASMFALSLSATRAADRTLARRNARTAGALAACGIAAAACSDAASPRRGRGLAIAVTTAPASHPVHQSDTRSDE